MIKELGELYRLIKAMNEAGLAMLIEAARDITSKRKFLKEETDDAVSELENFDNQVNQVLAMVSSHAEA